MTDWSKAASGYASMTDSWRLIALMAKASAEVGIDFELGCRFLTALAILIEADQKASVHGPDGVQ